MVSKEGENNAEEKKHTKQSAERAWLGITLAQMHEETQRGASVARQMRGWQSAWALCDFGLGFR